MFGVNIKLNYIENSGRFQGELPRYLKEITTTGRLPDVFKNQVANIDHQFHLTVTKKKRDELALYCSKAYYDTIADDQRLEFRGMYYAVGMEIKCINNFEIANDVRVTNKQIFEIIGINKEIHFSKSIFQ